jgi:hypothetical protein
MGDKSKMQKLDDIILKKGDVVYFEPQDKYPTCFVFGGYKECSVNNYCEAIELDNWHPKIIKIERPTKYETIYETPKEILTKEEKEYLEAVLKPFRDKIRCIVRSSCFDDEFIYIVFNDRDDTMEFPLFEKGTMYKGMEIHKKYTLEELGLFEEE